MSMSAHPTPRCPGSLRSIQPVRTKSHRDGQVGPGQSGILAPYRSLDQRAEAGGGDEDDSQQRGVAATPSRTRPVPPGQVAAFRRVASWDPRPDPQPTWRKEGGTHPDPFVRKAGTSRQPHGLSESAYARITRCGLPSTSSGKAPCDRGRAAGARLWRSIPAVLVRRRAGPPGGRGLIRRWPSTAMPARSVKKMGGCRRRRGRPHRAQPGAVGAQHGQLITSDSISVDPIPHRGGCRIIWCGYRSRQPGFPGASANADGGERCGHS